MALESFLSSLVSVDLDIGYSGVEYAQTSRLSGLGSCSIALGENSQQIRGDRRGLHDTSKPSLKVDNEKGCDILCLLYSTSAVKLKIVSSGRNLGILED